MIYNLVLLYYSTNIFAATKYLEVEAATAALAAKELSEAQAVEKYTRTWTKDRRIVLVQWKRAKGHIILMGHNERLNSQNTTILLSS